MPRRIRREKFYDSSRLNTAKLMESLEKDRRKKEPEEQKETEEQKNDFDEANNAEKDRN